MDKKSFFPGKLWNIALCDFIEIFYIRFGKLFRGLFVRGEEIYLVRCPVKREVFYSSEKYSFLKRGVVFLLAFYFSFFAYKTTGAQDRQPWVKVSEGRFVRDGKPFRFIGANAVNLVFYDDWGLDVEKAIRTAKVRNISVLRLYIDLGWGKSEDFDRIFDLAAKYGVYIILTFTDCCCSRDYSCPDKYFTVHAPFCNITNRRAVKAFKKLIKEIIGRKNSINGRLYRDDPVILAWDIGNELEYWRFTKAEVSEWVDEISGYIKSLDENHLVTMGIGMNEFVAGEGKSLRKMFDLPGMDFFSLHFYPSEEEAGVKEKKLETEYLSRMEAVIGNLNSSGKPVIIEEFGLSGSMDFNLKVKSAQPQTYNALLKEIMDTASRAGAYGLMFWGWGVPEEKKVPMWWSKESHNMDDKLFCDFIKKYNFP